MPAVAYPSTLPTPTSWAAVPRERRRVSSLPGHTQLAGRWRDRITDIEAEWVYTTEQMETWRAWYEDDLILGQRWFSMECVGAGGWTGRVHRFRTGTKRLEYLGNGVWRLSFRLGQRGRALAPRSIPNTLCDPSEPELFGEAHRMVRIPDTNELWAVATDGTDTYINVYDIRTRTHSATLMKNPGRNTTGTIAYLDGSVYAMVSGNSTGNDPDDDGDNLIHQWDVATRAPVGSGNTDYGGAVSVIGLILEANGDLHYAVTNGIGAGHGKLEPTAPYARVVDGGVAGSGWYYYGLQNTTSNIRAYVGDSGVLDLQADPVSDAFNHQVVNLVPYGGSSHYLQPQLLEQDGTDWIYVMNQGNPIILRVNTVTHAVDVIDTSVAMEDIYPRIMYYSPTTDRLWVQHDFVDTTSATYCFDGTTGDHYPELTTTQDVINTPISGPVQSIHLCGDNFIACHGGEDGGNELWRVSFGWR